MPSQLAKVPAQLLTQGYAALPSRAFPSPRQWPLEQRLFLNAWNDLVQDSHMADGGSYRFRRYSRFLLRKQKLEVLEGSSIFQELRDNPLNGGVVRTFAPLSPDLLENAFLRRLILADAEILGLDPSGDWQVGVHMVRIVATPECPGHPAPEGVHIDAERYTVQHLIERRNVLGGVFTTYTQAKQPLFHWLQLEPWDTVLFTGATWHGATPIQLRDSSQAGHRDTLLIDFHPLP